MSNKLEYSGRTSSYLHKWHPETPNDPNTKAGLRKVWYLDAQWSTCPVEVEDQVRDLWSLNELGNDQYMFKTTVDELIEIESNECIINKLFRDPIRREDTPVKTDYIVQYIREHGIPDDEQVIIHWWW
jgi:hypothetical protein